MHAESFVLEHTRPVAPPLVPELSLRTSHLLTPLWEAIEAATGRTGTPPPFWAFAWAGGQALARHLLDHPGLVRGRTVLDFGAGSGIVAIAAARAGASRVTAAEVDPLAVAAIRLNAASNGVVVETAGRDLAGDALPGVDVVTFGDMCYEQPLAARVTAWASDLARGGRLVLLGEAGRAYAPREGLTELARFTVPTSLEIENGEAREAVVWRVGA